MSNLTEETMPLSKARDRERKKQVRLDARVGRGLTSEANSNLKVQPSVQPVQPSVQPVQPSVQPRQHCRLPLCVICDPERYQEWFKQTYGYYDDRYI